MYLLEILKERWEPGPHPIPARGLHSDVTGVASRCRRPAAVASPTSVERQPVVFAASVASVRSQAALVLGSKSFRAPK